MEKNRKYIAAIFEEQKVFVTFSGDCYRYDKQQEGVRCFKMDKLSQKLFWDNYRQGQIGRLEKMTNWRPVAYEADGVEAGTQHQNSSGECLLQKSILNKLYARISADI